MTIICPAINRSLVIAQDARLAARISCAFAMPGHYLPVIEGPYLSHPDPIAELVRRNNAAGRAKPEAIFMAGLSDEAYNSQIAVFKSPLRARTRRVSAVEEVDRLGDATRSNESPLIWGKDRIGIGLLKALCARRQIIFTAEPSPIDFVQSKSGHLVVCEQGNDLVEVIAANYAFALRAGLCLIPEIGRTLSDELLERFYSVYDNRDASPTQVLEQLQEHLQHLTGPIPVPEGGSITFITGGLPLGVSVPEVPSTHLFKHPDLGIAVINGFAAEQPDQPGIGLVTLVDPETTEAHEISVAERLLPPRGAFVRTYSGASANVRDVTSMIELFPYDLMIIATHCGDVSGHRWTYEFKDSEGIDRRLIVDIAIGFGKTSEDNMLNVTQFIRFVSLDGIDWNDERGKQELHIGRAIQDFMEKIRPGTDSLQPVKKGTIDRVVGSSALKLHDHNLIVLPLPLADERTPVIINNACASWHRLALNFIFGGARAYVGTLFPVTTSEAQEVIIRLLDKHIGKPIAAALWSAQRQAYGDGPRRPYLIAGVYPQRLRIRKQDVVSQMISRLSGTLRGWERTLAALDPKDSGKVKKVKGIIEYYEQELAHFQRLAQR